MVREQEIILDVQGVGYVAFCSASCLRQLPPAGQAATLYIETHVREDHIHLYGFISEEEQSWFRLLVSVNGVGPKMALNILSTLTPDQLSVVIMSADQAPFKPVSGVGPKLAERIIRELQNKTLPEAMAGITPSTPSQPHTQQPQTSQHVLQEVVSALTNLGYGRSEVYPVVTEITQQTRKPPLKYSYERVYNSWLNSVD